MSVIGTFEWLKANALFGCQNESCAEGVSYHYDMLKVHDGAPICEYCYEDQQGEDDPDFFYLPAFDPFACCLKGSVLNDQSSPPERNATDPARPARAGEASATARPQRP